MAGVLASDETALGAPASPPASPALPVVVHPSESVDVPSPPIPAALLSPSLRNTSLRSPMPGGFIGGWYGDTGLDIAGRYLPVYAIADGTLEYSEKGHTLWTGKGDTPFSIRIRFDAPIPWGKDRHVTHAYYTHLSELVTDQPESSVKKRHVVAGERIAVSGIGNGVAHLHFGLLLDNQVEQDTWEFILREGDVRKVMGDYKNNQALPLH